MPWLLASYRLFCHRLFCRRLSWQLVKSWICRSLHSDRAAFCVKLRSNSIEAAVFHLFASAGCNSTFASVPLIAGVTRGQAHC
ncbi:MAG: hypothetical protein ABI895_10385 [Deltaproteobacteria bacterium]